MKKAIIELPEMMLIGIRARTNNKQEMDPSTAKISPTVQQYFHNGLYDKIPNRTKPGVTYCVYTDYDSDANGDYTYFIGELVSNLDALPEGFTSVTIPSQHYAKFTNGPKTMPDVCIEAWQQIWQMNDSDLGGKRNYQADFELYDERASDHYNVTLDICIGISQ